ncbi:poly-beta-1,6-N-acetyl-D-glucosamine synthase [Thioalkalivibrio sp. ALE19]|uniref:poly-beta-1,6-N-acetyl-D-glucosamine synthase n=1 Tax=Thioalkalivibrio sp. ALE19 TaxID=1266909 RepID=UPI00048FA5E9|nr:poly-beta-1,6-N-acetyl-D-glucosamine synthase [Thioalkalivibrio sp. ALE19]
MIRDVMFAFAFFYPLIMAWMWMFGGLWYYLRWERGNRTPPPVKGDPGVSIIIPCFNEEAQIGETIAYALASEYPDFEVIAVNDGSSDNSPAILDELAREHPRLRVIHLASNQGKAVALRTGALAARNEYLVCIDGDALLHPEAVHWLAFHLASGPRVGAVTGNPRILNRTTMLGKLQVGEFSSIIGLIKRAQRVYGRVFTVSGVIAGFRRTALDRVGYWAPDMVTEDIDISWRLQMDHWDVRYEANALTYIYMPETLRGLWKQRLRWAQGGIEALVRHLPELFMWRRRRFWMVALEFGVSVLWAYVILFIMLLYVVGQLVPLPPQWHIETLLPQWNGVILGVTCLIQFLVSLAIDRHYEPRRRFLRNYLWIIWYPLAFWVLSVFTTVAAFPRALSKPRGMRARWTSPDRGLRAEASGEDRE